MLSPAWGGGNTSISLDLRPRLAFLYGCERRRDQAEFVTKNAVTGGAEASASQVGAHRRGRNHVVGTVSVGAADSRHAELVAAFGAPEAGSTLTHAQRTREQAGMIG